MMENTENPLQFNYHYPDETLSEFVKYFWCLENNGSSKQVTVLPDGYFDIMFTFSSKSQFTVSLIGLATKPKDYVVPAHSKAFSISFKLPAAESILNTSITSIVDTRSLLPSDLWNIPWSTITSPETFFTTATACLTTMAPAFSDNRKRVLFENIYKTNGDIRVAELASLAHWDARKINQYFRGHSV